MVHFINLPADREIISQKIMRSREGFLKIAGAKETPGHRAADNGNAQGMPAITNSTDFFMFVLEDTQTGPTLGASQGSARMGAKGTPNCSLQLERRGIF